MCLLGTSLEGCKCIFLCLFCVCFESVFVLLGPFALVLFVCVLLWKGFITVVSLFTINCACFDLWSQSSVCVCFSTFEPKLSVRVFFNLWAKAQCACVFQPLSQSSVCVFFVTELCVCYQISTYVRAKFQKWIEVKIPIDTPNTPAMLMINSSIISSSSIRNICKIAQLLLT